MVHLLEGRVAQLDVLRVVFLHKVISALALRLATARIVLTAQDVDTAKQLPHA